MAVCIHGEVCRAWMCKDNCYAPLSTNCPNGCPYFQDKSSSTKEAPRITVYSNKTVIDRRGTNVDFMEDF